MKFSKLVATGIISGIFVFGLCQIQNATSAPQNARERADALKARLLLKKERILDRFGRGQIPNASWQPAECFSGVNCSPDSTASFITSSGQVQLQLNMAQSISCTQSKVGALITLPEGTSANTISFDRFDDVQSGPFAVRLLIHVFDSAGNEIGRADVPNTTSGNQQTFDLHNLLAEGNNSNVAQGATMRTVLLVATTKADEAFGTTRIGNVIVNGSQVQDIVFQSTCVSSLAAL